MKKIDKHRREVQALDEVLGYGWALIKYPKNKKEEAVYHCNAGHTFEMKPEDFLGYKSCPICELGKEVKRDNDEYKAFLRVARELNGGKCELTGDSKSVDVHHLYSMRKYAELTYHPKNSILINRKLHKEYHRKYSAYNTYSYTFLAWLYWLRDETKMEGVTTEAVNLLITKVERIMRDLEIVIAENRLIKNQKLIPPVLQKSITDKQMLHKMQVKADRMIKKIEHGETVELANGNVIVMHVYYEAMILYKNDYDNWLEYNFISGSILENAYKTIINA